ncbi:WD40 repeat domain-containing protein [Actinosynnema sp. NPDC049800]
MSARGRRPHPTREVLAHIARALRLESHHLARHPELTWQQLANRLQWSPTTAALVDAGRQDPPPGPVRLRPRTRPRESEALLRRLEHGPRWLTACAFVPGHDLMVSACTDRTLELWDTASGRPVRTLTGMSASPQSCAATPDGKFVLATTAGPAGTLHVWAVRDGRETARVTAHTPSCTACAVRPDGSAVFTFGTDQWVREWSLPELRPIGEPFLAPEPLTCGALSPDGSVLVYGGRRGVLYVRNLADGGRVTELVHGAPLYGCALGAGGRPVATCGADGRLVVWDLAGGGGTEMTPATTPIIHCDVTADGSLLAAASDDGRVHLWELRSFSEIGVLEAHTTTAVSTVLSADGEKVASVSGDGTVCLWSVAAATGSALGGHTGLVGDVTFTRAGTTLLTSSSDGTTRQWNTATGDEIGPAVRHPDDAVRHLLLGDDLVVAAGERGGVLLIEDVGAPPGAGQPKVVEVGEHGSQVWALAPLPGARAVTAGADGTCRVWDLHGRVCCSSYPGDSEPVLACAAASDGSVVFSAGEGGKLHIWDPATGVALFVGDDRTSSIRAVTVRPDDAVITVDASGTATLHHPETAWTPQVLGAEVGGILQTPALWTASGDLVTGGADGTLALRPTWGRARRWRAHQGPVLCVAASRSGSLLATGGADRMVVLWDSATGRELARLPCAGRVHGIAFHPDERVIAYVGDGGLVGVAELDHPGTC